MRMDDQHMELRFLKCVVDNETHIHVASLDESMFTHGACIKLLHKVQTLLDSGRDMISWESLCSSVHLEDAEKDWIWDTMQRVGDIETEDDLDYSWEQLKEYWKYRILQQTADRINTVTNGAQPADGTLDTVMKEIDQQLESIQGMDTGVEVWHLGQDCPETTELIERAINPDDSDFYPTGFAGYDEVNRGIPTTGVFMIAGNTGIGKSSIAANLCYHWKSIGLKPAIVPLEMDATEMTRRWISAIANVELSRITNYGEQNLTNVEKDMIYEGIMAWFQDAEENHGDFMLWAPKKKDGITLQEILYGVRREKADIIVIDQPSLIDNNTDDQEWLHLSNMIKTCKRFAWINKIPIVWLQQLDKDLNLRYASRTLDDADVAWFLELVDKENGLMKSNVRKVRGGLEKDFWIDFNRTYLKAEDAQDVDEQQAAAERKAPKSATKAKSSKRIEAKDNDEPNSEKQPVKRGHTWMRQL